MVQFCIVTINRNNLAGLIKTYASVSAQTYRDFRWIVIDGASTDGCVEWLAEVKDPRAEITSERDKSLYDAMNKGLTRAVDSAGYTLFLNSGDTFHDSQVLARVAQAIGAAKTMPRYVYGDYCRENAAGQLTPTRGKAIGHLPMGMPTSHQAMYFENQRLAGVRFRDEYKLSADYCLIIEFVSGLDPAKDVLRLDATLCNFDITGISQRLRFAALKEDRAIRQRFLKHSALHASMLYLMHYVHAHGKILRAASERKFGR
jgi:putative colanic acid biosynthesis glycosyltransferase